MYRYESNLFLSGFLYVSLSDNTDPHLVNDPGDGGPCLSGIGGFVAELWQTGLQHRIPGNDDGQKYEWLQARDNKWIQMKCNVQCLHQ